jgi:hypothetical protein
MQELIIICATIITCILIISSTIKQVVTRPHIVVDIDKDNIMKKIKEIEESEEN